MHAHGKEMYRRAKQAAQEMGGAHEGERDKIEVDETRAGGSIISSSPPSCRVLIGQAWPGEVFKLMWLAVKGCPLSCAVGTRQNNSRSGAWQRHSRKFMFARGGSFWNLSVK